MKTSLTKEELEKEIEKEWGLKACVRFRSASPKAMENMAKRGWGGRVFLSAAGRDYSTCEDLQRG